MPFVLAQNHKLGGKILGFNLDPRFANALGGLVVVYLRKTQRLERPCRLQCEFFFFVKSVAQCRIDGTTFHQTSYCRRNYRLSGWARVQQ